MQVPCVSQLVAELDVGTTSSKSPVEGLCVCAVIGDDEKLHKSPIERTF
jgi:hypothetical protein